MTPDGKAFGARSSKACILTASVLGALLGCSSGNSGGSTAPGGGAGPGNTGGAGGSSGSGGAAGEAGAGGGQSGSGGSGGTPTGGAGSGGAGGDRPPIGGSGGVAGGSGGSDAGTRGGDDGAAGSPDSGGAPTVAGDGCKGGSCLNAACKASGTAAAVGKFAQFGFAEDEHYIPSDVVIPTFDDGPDRVWVPADDAIGKRYTNFKGGDWTRALLDYLEANSLHFDFFINGNNFCDVEQNASCKQTVARILQQHNAANHTVHHVHMGSALPYDPVAMFNNGCGSANDKLSCDAEMMGVESLINVLSGGALPHLTRFRAPYGEPFEAGGAGLASVKATVAKYAVHVGWQVDSTDSLCDDCMYTGQKIASVVTAFINRGGRGIVLMHGTYPWSVEAAKILFDPKTGFVKSKNMRLGTVEDAICWKYGKHSWQIVQELNPGQTRLPN